VRRSARPPSPEEAPHGRIAHIPTSARDTSPRDTSLDSSALTLVSSLEHGLPERLAGRVDGHLTKLAEHMREGLLAASTAVGLEVMAELMDAEVAGRT
jgi:hypothetical protein